MVNSSAKPDGHPDKPAHGFGDAYLAGVFEGPVAAVWRSNLPFSDAERMRASFERIRPGPLAVNYTLLVDLRSAPGRNDAEFERDVAEPRRRMSLRFAKIAILVSTQVGRLQVSRHARADGVSTQLVTQREHDIAEFLGWHELALARVLRAAHAFGVQLRHGRTT